METFHLPILSHAIPSHRTRTHNHQNFKNDHRVVFFAELRAVTYAALATVSIALAVLTCGDQKRNPIPKIPRTAVMVTAWPTNKGWVINS